MWTLHNPRAYNKKGVCDLALELLLSKLVSTLSNSTVLVIEILSKLQTTKKVEPVLWKCRSLFRQMEVGFLIATLIYNLWRWISDSEYTKFDISSKALGFVKSNKCSKLKHKLEKEKNVPHNSFKLQLHVLNLVSEGKRNSCATMYEDWRIDEMGQPQF